MKIIRGKYEVIMRLLSWNILKKKRRKHIYTHQSVGAID